MSEDNNKNVGSIEVDIKKIKRIARDTASEIINEQLDSSIIFNYINNLEQKVKELEETISEAIYYVWSDENKDKQGWWTEALLNILQERKKTFYYSIPRKNIEDKIEELSNIKGDFATYIAVSERISVLQELLQESEDK